ncbi:MAG TPA: hypothetical protein VIZ43_16640 [Trebonia sp.]
MENNTIFVAVTRTGAACLGARSPWTTPAAVAGANHALGQNAVPAAGGVNMRSATAWPIPAPMRQLAEMSAELLPTAHVARKQTNVHKTRINAGGYGAMGPYPEREQPA